MKFHPGLVSCPFFFRNNGMKFEKSDGQKEKLWIIDCAELRGSCALIRWGWILRNSGTYGGTGLSANLLSWSKGGGTFHWRKFVRKALASCYISFSGICLVMELQNCLNETLLACLVVCRAMAASRLYSTSDLCGRIGGIIQKRSVDFEWNYHKLGYTVEGALFSERDCFVEQMQPVDRQKLLR